MYVICLDMMHANEAIQIELEEGSRDITMNMNAPEQYQIIIRHAIADCPGATNKADDIVEEHDRNQVTLLERLQERNLTLNKDKSKIGMINQIIVFIRMLLSQHGVGSTEEKVRTQFMKQTHYQCCRVAQFPGTYQFQLKSLAKFATTVRTLQKLREQTPSGSRGAKRKMKHLRHYLFKPQIMISTHKFSKLISIHFLHE